MERSLRADLQEDVHDVESMETLASLLEIICRTTGMRFSAVARVTDTEWTALAIRDGLSFGLAVGGQLDIHTTLCKEARAVRLPIVIEHASADPVYCEHHTPRLYNIESYVSVPIILAGGEYFGNLCALDPLPLQVRDVHVGDMFSMFAGMLATHLNNVRSRRAAELLANEEQANGLLRERFVAVLGHDLRNPLSSISAGVGLLQRAAHDEALVRATAQRIARSVDRMRGLVDDLMDFSRGRFGGGIGLDLREVDDLDAAFLQVVHELQMVHPDRDIRFTTAVLGSVIGDRTRLQQLLSNLLANAVTHGSKDTAVQVQVQVLADGSELRIEVTNEGDAIPTERRERLFEAFSFGSEGDRGNGLGLGLFICAQIVKAHGGTLKVVSEPGLPTSFVAALPLRRAALSCG